MGKKSTRENKTMYQTIREECNLTRAAASERMEGVSADRIEKIESRKSAPHPDEVLLMAEAYQTPMLCNHFCSQECPIGKKYVPAIELKNLPQIALEALSSINSINYEKNCLIDISSDGKITNSELKDFARIQHQLEKLSLTIETLQFWFEKHIKEQNLDTEKLADYRQKLKEQDEKDSR